MPARKPGAGNEVVIHFTHNWVGEFMEYASAWGVNNTPS